MKLQILKFAQFLSLPQQAIATALIYHGKCKDFNEIDPNLIAIGCLDISCKQHEIPRKKRDFVNAHHYVLYKRVLDDEEEIRRHKSTLSLVEMLILRVLNFNTWYPLPYSYLAIQCLDDRVVAQYAWNLVNEMMLMDEIVDLLDIETSEIMANVAIHVARCIKTNTVLTVDHSKQFNKILEICIKNLQT